jgi:two-component system, chemotaxis family, protein-glutamate methylesterase/glutaminase
VIVSRRDHAEDRWRGLEAGADSYLAKQRLSGVWRRGDLEPPPELQGRDLRWVGVAASTGGPRALRELLEGIPANAPASFLIVQHIAEGFEIGLAEWLNRELPLDVRLAVAGEELRPGAVRLAPAGCHLRLLPRGVIDLDYASPPRRGHRPSADDLFHSCALVQPRESAGVLLTGMGADGAEGLLALRSAGGLTLAQDEASCVVYGMPRVACKRGAVHASIPPREIAKALVRCWRRSPPNGGEPECRARFSPI